MLQLIHEYHAHQLCSSPAHSNACLPAANACGYVADPDIDSVLPFHAGYNTTSSTGMGTTGTGMGTTGSEYGTTGTGMGTTTGTTGMGTTGGMTSGATMGTGEIIDSETFTKTEVRNLSAVPSKQYVTPYAC